MRSFGSSAICAGSCLRPCQESLAQVKAVAICCSCLSFGGGFGKHCILLQSICGPSSWLHANSSVRMSRVKLSKACCVFDCALRVRFLILALPGIKYSNATCHPRCTGRLSALMAMPSLSSRRKAPFPSSRLCLQAPVPLRTPLEMGPRLGLASQVVASVRVEPRHDFLGGFP